MDKVDLQGLKTANDKLIANLATINKEAEKILNQIVDAIKKSMLISKFLKTEIEK